MTEAYDPLVEQLARARDGHRLPPGLRAHANAFAHQALGLLFPHFAANPTPGRGAIREELAVLRRALAAFPNGSDALAARFVERLAAVQTLLEDDAQAILEGDPAASSVDEVIVAYPGFKAIALHRVAHELHQLGMPLLPRLLTEHAHERTGIDLHPAARIGRRFCIDHGTGVVVGETTRIGDDVKLYQGVTLGALTVQKDLADRKRHPTLEDRVVVYAGATILGGETVIGADSIVAGNAFVTRSVPPNSLVGRNGAVRPRGAAHEQELDFII